MQDIPEQDAVPKEPYEVVFAKELLKRGKLRKAEFDGVERFPAPGEERTLLASLVNAMSERDAAEILAQVSGLPLVSAADYPEYSPLPNTVSPRFLRENRVVGLSALDSEFVVAVTDPFDGELLEALTLACDRPVRPCVGVLSEIDRALERQLGPREPLVGVIVEIPIERGRVDVLDDDRLRRQALAFAKGQLTELAGKWDVHFSANVLDKIVAHARAVPQTINAICRLATFTARLDGRRLITGDFVDQVARRLLDAPPGGVSRRSGQGNPVVIESGAWGQGDTRARAAEPAIPKQPGRIIPLVEPESGQEPFMSRLDSLNKILKHLQSESPGVEASALISEDGLMIASSLPQDLDETRVAGMTATLLNLGTRAGTELRRGDVQEVIVRGEHGYSVMINAGRGALLLVLANEQTKLGLIFFDMREAIKSIKVIL